jgi:hypothetical protein
MLYGIYALPEKIQKKMEHRPAEVYRLPALSLGQPAGPCDHKKRPDAFASGRFFRLPALKGVPAGF